MVSVGDESVELSEAIDVVREQLIKAQKEGRKSGAAQKLTFAVGKVTVEFTGEVNKTVGVGGGIKFWVLNADAKGERASGASQRVTVELIPQSPDGTSYKVSDGVDAPPQH